MKKLSLMLMGCSILTLMSLQLPTENASEETFLPIDTTLGELNSQESIQTMDFDSETF